MDPYGHLLLVSLSYLWFADLTSQLRSIADLIAGTSQIDRRYIAGWDVKSAIRIYSLKILKAKFELRMQWEQCTVFKYFEIQFICDVSAIKSAMPSTCDQICDRRYRRLICDESKVCFPIPGSFLTLLFRQLFEAELSSSLRKIQTNRSVSDL